jgi:GAF domain-containing protein
MKSNNSLSNATRVDGVKLLPAWLNGWKGIWILGAGMYMAIYFAWILVKWTDPAYEVLIAGLGYLPLGIFAAVCASYAGLHKQIERNTRRAWVLIALSVIALVLGDVIYTILENTIGIGFPDIPDVFYLLYYPLAFWGLITIPIKVYDLSQIRTWKLDLAIIVASSTSISWYFIIAPTALTGGESWIESVVAGAYPAMDMLLLASIVSILFRRSEVNTRHALYILGLGLLIYVFADIAYSWLVLQDRYISGSWVDILWTASYFFIGAAALRQASPYLVEIESQGRSLINWQTSLLPFLGLGTTVLVSLYAATVGTGEVLQDIGLFSGTVLAIFLTIVRQIVTIRENARLVDELNLASSQLMDNARILEKRVSERTRELESQTERLHIAAQIARDAASAIDLDMLLNRSTVLILERFKLYHTGIYLLDQKREYLVLTAASTDAGRQMLAENHKLSVTDMNHLARVVATGEPRIAQDTGRDTMRFNNPLLPNTRSEMILPLKVDFRTIGVLDVQSDQPRAFNDEDVAIMQILTDQLAIAIERTRLLQRVEEGLRELQQAYGRSTRESWKSLAESDLLSNAGYRFDNVRIQPINAASELGAEAMQTGQVILQSENGNEKARQAVAAIPIKLRGQSIGVVTVKLKEGYNTNTFSTIEQAVERLAASLESARLFEEARARADREQAIAQVSASISAAADFDSILRTTVEEIGKSLGDSEVRISILE